MMSFPTSSVWRNDSITRSYDLPGIDFDHAGPSSVQNHLGHPLKVNTVVTNLADFTQRGYVDFHYEMNFPDIFLAYQDYWVSILVDYNATTDGNYFRTEGNSLTIDASGLLGGVVSRGLEFMDVQPDIINASIEIMGQITGKGPLRFVVTSNIKDIPYRAGSGFYVAANILAIVLYNDITRLRPVATLTE